MLLIKGFRRRECFAWREVLEQLGPRLVEPNPAGLVIAMALQDCLKSGTATKK
jgi:hypothetical protein